MILWLYTRNTDIFPPDWGMLRRFSLDTFGSFFKHIFNRWTAFAAYFLTPGQPFTAFPRPLSARLASLSSAASVGNRIVPGRWLRRRMPSATPTELRQKIQYRRKHEERGDEGEGKLSDRPRISTLLVRSSTLPAPVERPAERWPTWRGNDL